MKAPQAAGPRGVTVTPEEAGQKLARFLSRRLNLPDAMLHRWIRQGQIRLNRGRTKPFVVVQAGDEVRLPPFALDMAAGAAKSVSQRARGGAPHPAFSELPPVVASFSDFIVFNKPAGLPAHGGSGHSVSLASLLAARFADGSFAPTLAHRLDKDTSGLIVAALSYAALRRLHEALCARELVKEYLAWAEGAWPLGERAVLRHMLAKKTVNGREIVCAAPGEAGAREAVTLVSRLKSTGGASLLHLRIMTGRTHQIRAQLAASGHPVCGDVKYGAAPPAGLFLHAARIIMPDETVLECLPPWRGSREVPRLPPPLAPCNA